MRGEEQGSKSPFSLLFEPISPSSLNVYLTCSPSSLLFPPISRSSQLFLGHFSLLPILFLPPLKKCREVSIKTRSTPASLSFKGQATKHTTVKKVYSDALHKKSNSHGLGPFTNNHLRHHLCRNLDTPAILLAWGCT